MRSIPRRSFTVEVKASSRRHATAIPSRIASPVVPRPRLFRELLVEPLASPAETRRILPSLAAPEAPQIELEPIAEEAPPRRRGRPRKVRPAPAEPVIVAAVAVEEATSVPPAAPQDREAHAVPVRVRATKVAAGRPAPALAPGERWKRRLGRWSR